MTEKKFCMNNGCRSEDNKIKLLRVSLIAALVLVIFSLGANVVQAQEEENETTEKIVVVKETPTQKKFNPDIIQIERLKVEPKNIEPGQTFKLSLELTNYGRRTVEDLTISMKPQQSTSYTTDESMTDSQTLSTNTAPSSIIDQTSQSTISQTQTQTDSTAQTQSQQVNDGIMPFNQGTKRFIDYLFPECSEEITYTLRASSDINSGVHLIDFSLNYEYDDRQLTSDLQVGVLVEGEEDLEVVDSNYLEINPGDEDVDVNAVIQNLGTREAKNIVVEPVIDNPFNTKTDQTKQLGNLDKDEKGSINLELDVEEDIDSGNYLIPLNVSYTIDNQRVNTQRDISVKITGEPDIKITGTYYTPESPGAGEEVTMIATIKNVGEKEIESVSIQGIEKVNQPVTYLRDKDFVGALDPGEAAQGALKLEFDGDAIPKNYQLKIMVSGVEDEEVYTFTEYPEMKVSEKKNKSIIERIMDILPFFS